MHYFDTIKSHVDYAYFSNVIIEVTTVHQSIHQCTFRPK